VDVPPVIFEFARPADIAQPKLPRLLAVSKVTAMLNNFGLKSLARFLADRWFSSKVGKRRTLKRTLFQAGAEHLESRQLLTNFLVTTANDDSGSTDTGLSLREAINFANQSAGADSITFASNLSGQRFQLTQGTLVITDPLTITGLGATNTVVDAQLASRVFQLTNTAGDVTFDSLTVTAGRTNLGNAKGAGVYSYSNGTFTLTNSTISASATSGTSAQGAGIFSFTGPVVLLNSTVSGNSTTGNTAPGGGIATNTAPITIINSTISGNTTQGTNSGGGGIATYSGNIKLVNATVAFNGTGGNSSAGGGLFSGATGAAGTNSITLDNSILADNSAAHSTASDFFQAAGVQSLFVNTSLVGINAGTTLTAAPVGSPDASGNYIGTTASPVDPMLGSLAINGSQTKTHDLLSGSPAIDGGDNSLAVDQFGDPLTLDQNGQTRILHTTIDMGATEGANAAAGSTVSFNVSTVTVNESAGTILLTVTRTGSTAQQISIPFSIGGTATNSSDYTVTSSPLVILAGSSASSIQLSIIDDSIVEGNETVIFTLGTPTSGTTLGSPASETVTIVDNDSNGSNSAPTNITLSSNSASENVAGAVVGSLTATDPNVGDTATFTIQSGGQGSQFVISGNQLKVGSTGLDYESLSGGVAVVTVRATDSGGLFFDKTFNINVTDVNETPTITAGQTLSVANGAAVGTVVGVVSAADPDTTAPNDTLTYSITGGNTSGAFSINSATGQLKVANQAAINSSTNPTFTLQIKVADGGSPALSATQNVTVNIGSGTGQNQAPTIPNGQVFTTAENRSSGSDIGTVVATDPDSTAPNDTLTYSIIGGNSGSIFTINSSTGDITVNSSTALNFEVTQQYVLTVKVADGGSPSLSATGTVTINVTDVNETPLIDAGQTFSVAQNAPSNTVVGTVAASDPDTGAPDNTLTYSIVSGNTSSAFTIDTSTGKITVNNPAALDPSVNPQFALVVQVADGGSPSLSTTQSVTVNVTASTANQPPTIQSGQVFSTTENRANGSIIGTVIASDPNQTAPNNTLTYSITGGNTNNAFTINSATGQITVNSTSALDYETLPQFVLQIKVTDGGTPSLFATGSVTVNLVDVNEAPSISAGQTFQVAQNADINTIVGTVSASDPDSAAPNDILTYSILSGNTSSAFGINASTGQIYVNSSSPLNPAVNPQFQLLIKVTDGGSPSLSATQTVTITVNSVNQPPTIPAGQTFSVNDNAFNGAVIGTVIANDPDTTPPNNTLTYTITGGNTDGAFSIDSSSGQLAVSNSSALNSVTTPQYILQLRVTDGGSPSQSAIQSVTINVKAPNHAPTIVANQSFSVTENSGVNTPVGTVIASDSDPTAPNNTLTYSITGGNTNGAFSINSSTGLISVANPSSVNFEASPTFALQVRVTDGGSPALSATQIVTISVTDVNENPIVPVGQVFSVDENSPAGTTVGTVQATDPDLNPPNNTLTFSIGSGNTGNAFTINPTTGSITVNNSAALTFANGSFYILGITVSDGGSPSLSTIQSVRVNLNDVNQAPSIVSGQTFTVAENSAANTVVGHVLATDPDATAPNSTLTYSILSGNTNNAFAINPTTGQITVNNPSAVNFEATPQFSLQVQATDGGSPTLAATQIVTVNVTNVNEAPIVPAGQSFSVTEHSATNTIVGTVAATDPDATAPNNTLTYSIAGGNTNNAFAIDPTTGQISVSNSAALNAATNPQFLLQIQVADGGSPSLSTNQTVTVNVADVNEAPSIPAGQTLSVPENSTLNTVVGTVLATDPDATAPNKTLTYSITSGNTNGAFAINSTNGQITVNNPAALNFEASSQFTLQVQVSDGGSPSLSATNSVTVNVTNVDEAPILPTGQSFTVTENSPTNTVVGTITATDPDTTPPNSTVTYSIVGGNTGNTFSINSTTGQIFVLNPASLNFESTPVFTLQVKATDGGGLTDQQNVIVNLTDANDAPIIPAGQQLSVAEHSQPNTVVGSVVASDPDQTAPNNTLTYSLAGGNTDGAFAINAQTGQITVANMAALSVISNPTFTLQVTATDGGSPALSTTQAVTVVLTDVNEAPVIASEQAFSLPENPTNGQLVGTVTATDPDTTAPNDTLTYSITAGNTGNAFAINSTTGQITVINPAAVNFETNPQFNLQIQVTDGGTPTLTSFGVVRINSFDVDEAPVISAGQSFTIAEHSANSTAVGTVVATDPDTTAPNKTLTYSITGGNANQAFAIDPATGAITVNTSSALDFTTTPTFTLQVTVADGGGLSATQNVVVHLLKVNQPPVLTISGTPPAYIHHGNTAVTVLPGITVSDPDSATDLERVIISLPIPSGRKNRDTVNINALSAIGTVIDTTENGRRQITVILDPGITTAAVQNALQSITFTTKGTGLKLTHRDFQVQVIDHQGAASNVITQDITVSRRAARKA
jgi:VCBS repeat-containing protein